MSKPSLFKAFFKVSPDIVRLPKYRAICPRDLIWMQIGINIEREVL